MNNRAYSDLVTDTYTYEAYTRGTLRYQLPQEVEADDATHFGSRTWIFVHNDEGSALAQGDVLEMGDDAGTGDAGFVYGEVVKSENTAQLKVQIVGVADHAIGIDEWGWVIAKGYCEIACDGNVSADTRIVSDTSGQCTDVTVSGTFASDTSAASFGWATEVDAGAASLVTAVIDCL